MLLQIITQECKLMIMGGYIIMRMCQKGVIGS